MASDDSLFPRPCSYAVPAPDGRERIYTTLTHNRLLLTADGTTADTRTEGGIVMQIQIDGSTPIVPGTHLLSLGIPLFGMVTGIFPVPSVDGKIRVILAYHPLPKPNMGNRV